MLRRRKILLALTVALVPGSLASTIGYAMHLRSRGLRDRIAADLSRRINLQVDLGGITPLSFSSRRFNHVRVRLPPDGTEVAEFASAVWRPEYANAAESYALDLSNGWLLVGSGHWSPQDYQQLLKSGFGHDFHALQLARVRVHQVDFRWSQADFAMTAPAASGDILFDDQGRGHALLTCYRLNRTAVEEPIQVSARFTPGAGVTFQEAELRVGRIPMAALALDPLLGTAVDAGTFTGRITYRDRTPPAWELELQGALHGGRLEQLTSRVIGGPFAGAVDVTIHRACFTHRTDGRQRLTSLSFEGRLVDLQLADFASLFREPQLNGRVDLTVHQADYAEPDLEYVRLSGEASEVSLVALTRLLGYGVITGRLKVRINTLAVVRNAIQFADVDLIAVPPASGPAYIEKSALATLAREVFGLDLGRVLPERVEYVQMGVNLLVDREGLRVRGTHGPDSRTILTVRLLGRDVAILKQPDRVYPVEDLVAAVRARLQDYDADEFIRWWTLRHADPETRP